MKEFGHQRPIRNREGEVIELKSSPARAVTREVLDGSFGLDRGRKIIVSLEAGDLIVLRAARTQRPYRLKAHDVYRWAIHCAANRAALEKARQRKARKAELRASQQIARADRKLRLQLRKEKAL